MDHMRGCVLFILSTARASLGYRVLGRCFSLYLWLRWVYTDSFYFKTELTNEERVQGKTI